MNNGQLIDNRYEIIETIGKGGMAIVYKAKCLVLNRYVAIKVLRPEFRSDGDFIKRFRAEAQAAGALSHQNIVSVYDVSQDGDIDYIVMEYVEGVTLKQYIDAKGILPWKEAVDYAGQICSGLEHAHQKGIVHKDIKPHNIMITREGILKITDFGIAKVVNAGTIAANSMTLGSVHYFSPEQARGGYIDLKTDIYSLGVLLYEMTTGTLPFDGDTAVSVAMQHIEKNPVKPRMLNPNIPESFENVILKAMCKSPQARYESAGKMLIDLKKVYIGAEVAAGSELASGETTVMKKIQPEDYNNNPQQAKEQNKTPDNEKEFINIADYEGENSGEPDDIPQDNKKGKKEKKKGKEPSKKSDVVGILAGIGTGILLIIIAAFFIMNPISFGGEKVELPDFVGMTVEEAQEIVVDSEIKIVVEKEKRDETKEDGVILSQSPKGGEMVKPDCVVKVIINASAEQFELPDVENETVEDAKRMLSELELNVSVETEESETVAKGHVIRQSPSAGDKVSKGSYITIYVSSGKEQSITTVPNLVDLSIEEAKSRLLEEGLVWGSIIYVESQKPVNTVIAQEIRPDKEVKEKTSIDLKVSKGPASNPPTHAPNPPTQTPQQQPPTAAPQPPTEAPQPPTEAPQPVVEEPAPAEPVVAE